MNSLTRIAWLPALGLLTLIATAPTAELHAETTTLSLRALD